METNTEFSNSTGENVTGSQSLKKTYITDVSDPDPSISVQAQASSDIMTETTMNNQRDSKAQITQLLEDQCDVIHKIQKLEDEKRALEREQDTIDELYAKLVQKPIVLKAATTHVKFAPVVSNAPVRKILPGGILPKTSKIQVQPQLQLHQIPINVQQQQAAQVHSNVQQ